MTLDDLYRRNKAVEGRVLAFRADRGPVSFVLLVFAAQLAAWHWLSPVAAAITGVCLLPLLGSCAIYNHHHQHRGAFNSAALNRLFELVLGTQTMILSYAWVLHHNFGHHPNYLNQPPCPGRAEDESRWARRDGGTMGRLEYTLNLLLRAPWDALRVGRRRPREWRAFLLMLLPHFALQAVLLWWHPFNYLAVFLLPAFAMLLYVYWLTYEHHSGLHTDDPFAGSRNRTGRFYNWRTCNLGYHTAHHLKPNIHWSLLPDYHEMIKDRIPLHCFVDGR
jgi:fatty acid desaturase